MKMLLKLAVLSFVAMGLLTQADEVCDTQNRVRTKSYATLRSCSGWALNRLPVVKAWIRERAQTVFTDNVKIDYVGGDPRFIVEHTYDETCSIDGGASFVKPVVETT